LRHDGTHHRAQAGGQRPKKSSNVTVSLVRQRSTSWIRLKRVRQAVQLLALALYIYLLFAALQRRAAFPLADLFFRLDPLAALSASLASRVWISRFALALVTLALTLTLGRVWWLACPLGATGVMRAFAPPAAG
jgi:uncharacterized membrane protein YhfC